jgi:hypothetical protein
MGSEEYIQKFDAETSDWNTEKEKIIMAVGHVE